MKAKNKKGMTMIEVMIAIAIFAVSMEGFVLLFSRSLQINAFTLRTGQASLTASRGVQKTVDIIRNARQADNGSFVVVSADDNDLVIYGNADGDSETERIHYYLDGGILKEGVTEPTGDIPPAYPAGDQATSVVTNYVVNGVGTPVFEYYDINNNVLSTPAVVNSVKMAKVYLEINIDPVKSTDKVIIQSYATIRNLGEFD